jgi:hypothetical protein
MIVYAAGEPRACPLSANHSGSSRQMFAKLNHAIRLVERREDVIKSMKSAPKSMAAIIETIQGPIVNEIISALSFSPAATIPFDTTRFVTCVFSDLWAISWSDGWKREVRFC